MDVSKLNFSTEQLKALSEAVNAELSIKQDEKYTMVKLYNFSKKDFSHTWNSKNYFIKAGGTLFIQDYIAEHLAKHLINREELFHIFFQVTSIKSTPSLRGRDFIDVTWIVTYPEYIIDGDPVDPDLSILEKQDMQDRKRQDVNDLYFIKSF